MKNQIVEKAISMAIKSIQDDIGQKSGDVAGLFFDYNNTERLAEVLREYIECENVMGELTKLQN